MDGFIITVKIMRIISGFSIGTISFITNSIPSDTKNIVAKKSLNDFTLPMIAKLYGREARLNPARNAPIAIERFR